MRIDILSLFPGMFASLTEESIIARAREHGYIDIQLHQIRDFTENRQNQVDDYPYGGGRGCVMQAQPLHSGLEYIKKQQHGSCRTIYLSPHGKVFTQEDARRLGRDYDNLILVCGHYEGIDQRFIDACVDEEISIGDFVLTGGEIPAMAVADSVCRLLPGVLSNEECFTAESHWSGVLEHPQYSRPENWMGQSVPEILVSGNHGEVEKWRRKASLRKTLLARPDMFRRLIFSMSDLKLIDELKLEDLTAEAQSILSRLHTKRITVRKSTENDLQRIKRLRTETNPHSEADITPQSLHAQGAHFSIYADSLGFCGEVGYRRSSDNKSAEIFIYLLPHSRGRGIGGYSVKSVVSQNISDINTFTLPEGEKERSIWDRLGFNLKADTPPVLNIS